jgi:D-3-phosphoglycerate dehydrogenase
VKVLIADKLASFVPGRLQDLGADPVLDPSLDPTHLDEALARIDPEVLVVRSTKVTESAFEAAKHLSLVIRAGAGVNTIDVVAASKRGIYVANCPGKNAAAVAELTLGHLLNLDRRIADNVASLRSGQWQKKAFGSARGIKGKTLAVLGCGTIGQEVIVRARAFGMHIVGWSRSLTPALAEELEIDFAATPEDAVRRADAITVHLALTGETRGRIGESVFDAMPGGSYFINTSRGEVVDQTALTHAIATKSIRAGLDVFAEEPSADGPFEGAIGQSEHVYGTHHIGASTQEASDAVAEEVLRIVRAYAGGEPIPNCVNLAVRTDATHTLVVRHEDQVGVLAHVLDILREAGINVQEMQNILFLGAEAACARIAIMGEPNADVIDRIQAHPSIFAASASPLSGPRP